MKMERLFALDSSIEFFYLWVNCQDTKKKAKNMPNCKKRKNKGKHIVG
jgi:hypothetical protein